MPRGVAGVDLRGPGPAARRSVSGWPPRAAPTSADVPRWAATVTFPPGLPQRLPPAGRKPCVAAALQKSTGPGTDHVGRRLAERHAVPSPCPSSRGQVTPVSGEPPRPRGSGSPSTRSLLETRAGSHEDLVWDTPPCRLPILSPGLLSAAPSRQGSPLHVRPAGWVTSALRPHTPVPPDPPPRPPSPPAPMHPRALARC